MPSVTIYVKKRFYEKFGKRSPSELVNEALQQYFNRTTIDEATIAVRVDKEVERFSFPRSKAELSEMVKRVIEG